MELIGAPATAQSIQLLDTFTTGEEIIVERTVEAALRCAIPKMKETKHG